MLTAIIETGDARREAGRHLRVSGRGRAARAKRRGGACEFGSGLAWRRSRRGGLRLLLLLLVLGGEARLRFERLLGLRAEVVLGLLVAGHLGKLRLLAQDVGLLRPGVRVVRVEVDGLLGEAAARRRALIGLIEVGLVGRLLVVDEHLVRLVLGRLVLLLLSDVVGALPLLAGEDDQG